jgi:hypothetical protein
LLDWLGESKVADAAGCAVRTNGSTVSDPLPLEYGYVKGREELAQRFTYANVIVDNIDDGVL